MAELKIHEHHAKAAEHHEHAAKHHKEAAKHHAAGHHVSGTFRADIWLQAGDNTGY